MTRDLKNALSSLGASVRARSEAKAPTHAVQLELPIWPEATRGVPNAALRCALFTARGKGRRGSPVDKLLLASTDGLRIYFTGTPLDQADLDVWEECLNRAMRSGMGVRIEFTAQKFLKAIGRSTGGKDVAWLKEAFRRLAICLVEIEDGKRTYFGHLIEGGALDEQTGQYVIAINEGMVKLYGIDGWTQMDLFGR